MAFPTKVYCATQALGVYYTDSFVGPETGQQPTWAAVNGGLPNTLCQQFALDPHAPETRQFVLLTDGSLHMRESGGNWAEILDEADAQTALGLAAGKPTAFCCDTLNPGVLYVSHTGGLLDINPRYLKSTDYGSTWSGGQVYASNTGKTRNAGLIRAHGDAVYIGWNGRTVAQGIVFYSTNGGASWLYSGFGVGAGYTPLRGLNPLTPGYAYAMQYVSAGEYDMYTVPPQALLREDRYPSTVSSMRFHPTDADRQLLLCGGTLCKTYDGWATIDAESPSSLGANLTAICPQWWADDDVIIGYTYTSAYAIGAIQELSDTTPTPLAGSSYDSSPYTDSIPETHGGVCWDGIQAIISLPTEGPFPPDDDTIEDPGGGGPITVVGGGGLVQAVSMPNYTGIHRGVPMAGDRAAFDVHNYPEEHASDTHEGVSILHLDPDAAAGEGPVMGPDGKYLSTGIATQGELDTHEGTADAHHDPVTLGANADTLLSLSTQEVGLDNQDANKALMGPASGAAAAPTFRALANADLPDPLAFKTVASALGIVSGAVTATQNLHTLTSESGTSDDLDTITAAADRTLLLIQATATHTITVKHGTGNISLNGAADFELTGNKSLLLFWNGTAWVDLGAGGGGEAALTVEEIDGTPSVASVAKILVTNGTLTDNGSGEVQLDFGSAATDGAAIHDNVAEEIHAITAKGTPVDADELVIEDSADSWNKKRVALGDLPGGAGGAPTDADYVVETANGSLSAESVLGTTVITTAAYASRQAAAKAGRIFLPNDGFYIERDTGAAWAPWGPIYPMTPPPTLANWTWFNQDAATADETYGGICLVDSGAHANVRGLGRAVPSTPYVITAAILPRVLNGDYKAGVYWADDAGKIITFCITAESPGQISIQKWNSVTAWSANYTYFSAYTCYGLFFLRMADDGTNRTCQYSHDGQHWETLHSIGRTDFLTATKVGICTRRANTTRTPALTLLSWEEA